MICEIKVPVSLPPAFLSLFLPTFSQLYDKGVVFLLEAWNLTYFNKPYHIHKTKIKYLRYIMNSASYLWAPSSTLEGPAWRRKQQLLTQQANTKEFCVWSYLIQCAFFSWAALFSCFPSFHDIKTSGLNIMFRFLKKSARKTNNTFHYCFKLRSCTDIFFSVCLMNRPDSTERLSGITIRKREMVALTNKQPGWINMPFVLLLRLVLHATFFIVLQ